MPLTEREPRAERRMWNSVGGGLLLFSTLAAVVAAPGGKAAARQVRVTPQPEAPAPAELAPMALRLRNGHTLVAQQKPPALVEMGPQATAPLGVGSAREVVGTAPRPAPDAVALKVWASGNVASLRDLSGIGEGADGIYLLSAKSRTLCRLSLPLAPDADRFAVAEYWLLPPEVGEDGRLDFRDGRPVVAAHGGAAPASFMLANAGHLQQIRTQ